MHFAMWTSLYDATGGAETPDAVIENVREQAQVGEQLGFGTIWFGEHHFGPYPHGDLPNPILVGADLVARTSTIRIGQMANIAPWWHPIRLAEDIALLDNMAKGRVDVGFGRGIWPYEGPQFHPHADPRKDRENRELFAETIEVVRKAWTEEFFSHEGPNYTFPAPDTAFSHPMYPPDPAWRDGNRVLKLRVTPKPYTKPHPPLWMTVSTDRSVEFAARLGLQPMYWQPPARKIRERMELYGRVRNEVEGHEVPFWQGQAVLRNMYVGESVAQVKRDMGPAIMEGFQYNDPFRGREVFANPGEQFAPEQQLDFDFLEPRTLLVGDPEHVAERIQELIDVCHLEHIAVGYGYTGMTQRDILKNLERFATKVMPHFTQTPAREPATAL